MAREDENTIRDGYGYAEAVIDAADEVLWASKVDDGRRGSAGPRGGAAGRRHRGDARPGVGARVRAVEVDARGAVRWALVLAGCWALFRLCVWLSWGLWAVTR